MRTNMKFWPAKRMLCLALCILMLVGIAAPSSDAIALDSRESLLGRLFGVTEAYAAEADVTTWNTCGTCEWGIDPNGCLWIRPTNGTSGTLDNWGSSGPPWHSSRSSVKSMIVKQGVSASTCYMFCYQLGDCKTIDLSMLNTSNVTNMSYMFYQSNSLKDLNVRGLDTSKVTDMSYMFRNCYALNDLDFSSFDTSNVTNMYRMFDGETKVCAIKLGENFTFAGNNISDVSKKALLLTPSASITTGKWILEGDTTGASAMTPEEMRDAGTVTPGTWVWDRLPIARLYSNGDLVFQGAYDPIDESRGTSVHYYNGFVTANYTLARNVPWYNDRTKIHEVYFECQIVPSNTANWFNNCSNLTLINNIENLNTRNVTNMSNMFNNCSSLTSLDVSNFDTSNVTNMSYMFNNCSSLNTIKLGEDFAFNGKNISSTSSKALLPTPPSSTTTGKWVLEDDELEASAMTPAQMRDLGTVTPGTWVWQEKPTKYTVIYHYNDGTGSTNTEKYVAAEAATLSSTYPARFNKTVTSWNTAEDGTGTSYELGATIPANTYAIGDVVDLYAIWEDSTAFTNVSEGVYQFQIPGNAQIKLDGLPAGTVYRISEMLPNGWILVNQSNSSGSIGPLTNSVSTFINKYMPESASAAIYATKTMDGAPATEDMAFEFTLKEGDNVIQTVTAANGAVLFDPIIYTSAGTHVYTIVENWETYSGPLDASGVTFDTHVETVTVEVSDNGGGKLSAEVTYDADGPAFANRTNPGDLIITKNVIGQTAANADDTFTFTIRIKSPTGGNISSASIETGTIQTTTPDTNQEP